MGVSVYVCVSVCVSVCVCVCVCDGRGSGIFNLRLTLATGLKKMRWLDSTLTKWT